MAEPPKLPDIDGIVELGDTSRALTQEDVNRVYGQVYRHMEKECKAAQAEGKPVKFLIGDRHYIPNPDPSADPGSPKAMIADSDDVIVGLCAIDAAKRLGIRDYTLEWDKGSLDKNDIAGRREMIFDEVSFKHYLNYAADNGIKFRAADPGGHEISDEELLKNMSPEQIEKFGKLLEAGKPQEVDAFMQPIIQKINASREKQMTVIIDDKTPSLSVVGAEHLPGLSTALQEKYHVAPIVCFSSDDGQATQGKKMVEDMLKSGRATRFVVDGKAVFLIDDGKGNYTPQRSNLPCVDLVKAASAGYVSHQAGVTSPDKAAGVATPSATPAPLNQERAAPTPQH